MNNQVLQGMKPGDEDAFGVSTLIENQSDANGRKSIQDNSAVTDLASVSVEVERLFETSRCGNRTDGPRLGHDRWVRVENPDFGARTVRGR